MELRTQDAMELTGSERDTVASPDQSRRRRRFDSANDLRFRIFLRVLLSRRIDERGCH